MKKLLFIIVAAVLCIAGAKAQQTVAVLTHEGTSKTFSGYHALQEAYTEAVSGDLITLSSGTFRSIESVEKAIKIRGMGMEKDTVYNTMPTILDGDMTLDITDDGVNNFHLEGIYSGGTYSYLHSQKNVEFVKCRLGSIARGIYKSQGSEYSGTLNQALFYHCKITGQLECNEKSSMTVINSYVCNPRTRNDSTSVIIFLNCVIYNTSTFARCVDGCTLTNSIIGGTSWGFNDKTLFSNCLIRNAYGTPDKSENSYSTFDDMLAVFKTFNGLYSNTETFELLDGQFFGLGMYGGSFPYSPRVTGPHIQSMEVAPRSTEEGKLNVKIKVENTTD